MRYHFGVHTLDLQRFELRRSGEVIPLRRKAFDLLAHLLTHCDRVVSRQELLDALWPDQIVSDGVLDSCLATARRALGDSGRTQRVIKTQHGRGYRFIATVTTAAYVPSDDTSPPVVSLRSQPSHPDTAAISV